MNDIEFPEITRAAQIGDKGVRIVEQIVTDDFGWIFREQEGQKDFGIDAHIEIVEHNKVHGRIIAAQIKTGKSFFQNKNQDGYVYYGDDQRELYEIAKVREWFTKLNEDFHYWLYFLSKESKALLFVTTTLCDCQRLSNGGFSLDKKCVKRFIEAHFTPMNEMCKFAGVPEQEIYHMSNRAIQAFFPEYVPRPYQP